MTLKRRVYFIQSFNLLNKNSKNEKDPEETGVSGDTQDETSLDFPGGAVVTNPPVNAGDMGSSPGPGGSHMTWSN